MKQKIIIRGFADRVEDVIAESGLSKIEIAKRCGCNRKVFISMDDRMLGSGILAKFCALMNVSSDYLLGLSTKKNIQK